MAGRMQVTISPDGWPDITINGCDTCGHVWPSLTERTPERCPARACRTKAWNGGKKSNRGRPDKGHVQAQGHSPILDGRRAGEHHRLCPCLSCLRGIGQPQDGPRRAGRGQGAAGGRGTRSRLPDGPPVVAMAAV